MRLLQSWLHEIVVLRLRSEGCTHLLLLEQGGLGHSEGLRDLGLARLLELFTLRVQELR